MCKFSDKIYYYYYGDNEFFLMHSFLIRMPMVENHQQMLVSASNNVIATYLQQYVAHLHHSLEQRSHLQS